MKNIEGVEITRPNSPKKEFKAKLKDLNRSLQEHEKSGFAHLEDCERRIRARRNRSRSVKETSADLTRTGKAKESQGDRSASALAFTLTKKKNMDLGAKTSQSIKTRQFNPTDNLTPDDLFRATTRVGSKSPVRDHQNDKMMAKMAQEMGVQREELANLRAKLKAMEEGQMTVDNVRLTRQLDNEKGDLNKERNELLKGYAVKQDKLDDEKKKLIAEIKKREAEVERIQAEMEAMRKKLDVDRMELDDEISTLQ